jgi:transposase
MKYTLKDFNEKFADDDACINYMFEQRYGNMIACPKCGVVEPKYYRVRSKKVYECKDCGNQISPLANTIFHKSDTPLKMWFYVIFMFSVSKNGVSAKEVERTLGVTYKTAWRMAKLVRSLMQQSSDLLTGVVETDETYIGGTRKLAHKYDNKSIVFGVVERGGRAKVKHVKSSGARVLLPEINRDVEPNTIINTDEFSSYRSLKHMGYTHTTVNHSKLEYVRGVAHTNTVEGFWSQLKRSIDGTYHAVSPKYLQNYLNEFTFRYNYRTEPVFPILISQASQRVR